MCGIAGIVDLTGKRQLPEGILAAMANALIHRGPDEDGFLERPGLGLASRRLSIIGLADGRQRPQQRDNGCEANDGQHHGISPRPGSKADRTSRANRISLSIFM